jgi:Photoprotection regulator fluorescence recovery protein
MERESVDQFRQDSMHTLKWSAEEKKIARRIFDEALQRELDAVIQKIKHMALDIKTPADLWKMEDYLTRTRKAIDEKYDYRYSQLPLVFAQLVREGRISYEDLDGLAENKLGYVRFMQESSRKGRT